MLLAEVNRHCNLRSVQYSFSVSCIALSNCARTFPGASSLWISEKDFQYGSLAGSLDSWSLLQVSQRSVLSFTSFACRLSKVIMFKGANLRRTTASGILPKRWASLGYPSGSHVAGDGSTLATGDPVAITWVSIVLQGFFGQPDCTKCSVEKKYEAVISSRHRRRTHCSGPRKGAAR